MIKKAETYNTILDTIGGTPLVKINHLNDMNLLDIILIRNNKN